MRTVFLDRDGVICHNRRDHVKSWAEFQFLRGAVDAIVLLSRAGCQVVVVTNQAVINRGQMTVEQVEEINRRMVEEVAAAGGCIEIVLYCPHLPDEGCSCRKPRTGMMVAASEHLGIELGQSYLVGDHWTDIQAGLNAGCRTMLVLSGRGLRTLFSREGRRRHGYLVSRNLKQSVKHILHDEQTWPHNTAQRSWHSMGDSVRISFTFRTLDRLRSYSNGAGQGAGRTRIGTVETIGMFSGPGQDQSRARRSRK